jgi:hypothetical protein
MKPRQVVLGFRVKSGWAASILLIGSIRSPKLSDSRVIELSDPHDPTTRQPYHAAMGKLETNAAKLKRRTQSVNRTAKKSVADLLKQYANEGYAVCHAGLVIGSQIDPDTIANSHIRAHALEGRFFRAALAGALQARGVRCSTFTERDIYVTAAKSLERSPDRVKDTIASLGRSVNGPWRADQKLAALAAWMSFR